MYFKGFLGKISLINTYKKNKIFFNWKKSIAGLLLAVIIGNQLGAFGIQVFQVQRVRANFLDEVVKKVMETVTPPVKASTTYTPNHDEHGLIAIVVEKRLLEDDTNYRTKGWCQPVGGQLPYGCKTDDKEPGQTAKLREHILSYANNVQNRIPHSRTIILETEHNEDPYKIATTLERLYFEGLDSDYLKDRNGESSEDSDNNRLQGVVIIGDLPLPIVYDEEKGPFPSIYPYVDFYRKRFIFNHETGNYETNSSVTAPTPEVWHGVISPPTKDLSRIADNGKIKARQELADFFYKNNRYHTQPDSAYANFDQRILHANFPAMEKQLNPLLFKNYKRYLRYAEEMLHNRYTKDLVKQLITEVTQELNPELPPSDPDFQPIIDYKQIDVMPYMGLRFIVKKYTTLFAHVLKVYHGRLNDAIKELGRWEPGEVDALDGLIALRDQYSFFDLAGKQLTIEGRTNQIVKDRAANIKVPMAATIVAALKVYRPRGANYLGSDYNPEYNESLVFSTYLDGQDMSSLTDANECSMYRGQYIPLEEISMPSGKTGDEVCQAKEKQCRGVKERINVNQSSYHDCDDASVSGAKAVCATVEPLVNNSVYTMSNRMYNPKKGPDGQENVIFPPVGCDSDIGCPPREEMEDVDDIEDWRMEDDFNYQMRAGCVHNNTLEMHETITVDIDEDETKTTVINLSPERCYPQFAVVPLYDSAGSKELFFHPEYDFAGNEIKLPHINREAVMGLDRCSPDRMLFRLANPEFDLNDALEDDIDGITEYKYRVKVEKTCPDEDGNDIDCSTWEWKDTKLSYSVNMAEVMSKAYQKLSELHAIESIEWPDDPGLLVSATFAAGSQYRTAIKVIQALAERDRMKSDGEIEYKKIEINLGPVIGLHGTGKAVLELWADVEYTDIEDDTSTGYLVENAVQHIEPSQKTLRRFQETMIAPAIPVDGVRFIEFQDSAKNNETTRINYFNPFRITGDNEDEIVDNAVAAIGDYDSNMIDIFGSAAKKPVPGHNGAYGPATKVFLEDPGIVESIMWRVLSIDQKLANIVLQYLVRDDPMPVPGSHRDGMGYPPIIRPPNGYEVMHLLAEGDVWGYQFGLNRAALLNDGWKDDEADDAADLQATMLGDSILGDEEGGLSDNGGSIQSKCGDPTGVEIWEWFDALMCWIEEEIIPLAEGGIINMDDMSCGAVYGEEMTDEEIEAAFVDPIADNTNVPADFRISFNKKSLVKDIPTAFTLYPLNESGDQIYGFVPEEVKISILVNGLPSSAEGDGYGMFNTNSFFFFEGEQKIEFFPLKTGSIKIQIEFGEVAIKTVDVDIYDKITVELDHGRGSNQHIKNIIDPFEEDENGDVTYPFTARLYGHSVDPPVVHRPISNITTNVPLSASNPVNGRFIESIRLEEGDDEGAGVFMPTLGPGQIQIISRSHAYTVESHENDYDVNTVSPALDEYPVYPPPPPPIRLVLQRPGYLRVGGLPIEQPIDINSAPSVINGVDIPIVAVDRFGQITPSYDGKVNVYLTEKTKEFATLIHPGTDNPVSDLELNIVNGKGKVRVKAGRDTSLINIIVEEIPDAGEEAKLAPAIEEIPIIARVDIRNWDGKPTQNLFASFLGFPAANFMEQDYFGGVHLFGGKTEAVFGFMNSAKPKPILTIDPNFYITLGEPSRQIATARLKSGGKKLNLQVIDPTNLQTILQTRDINIHFQNLKTFHEGDPITPDTLYYESLSEESAGYQTFINYEGGDGYVDQVLLADENGSGILEINKNKIVELDSLNYRIILNNEADYKMTELLVHDGYRPIARLMLNFKQEMLGDYDFTYSNSSRIEKSFSGRSTRDPSGVVVYRFGDEAEKDEELSEYYGLEDKNKYLKLFAGGAPIGEAVMWNMPDDAVLLGDPTISIKPKIDPRLNYDSSIGRKVFQDPNGSSVMSMTHFNYNNDEYEDVALMMQDGRVRLLEGGPTDPELIDRGDIAYLADGTVDIEAFDFENDGYEDLVLGTHQGRLAILNNRNEIFTRTNQNIKIGKKMYEMKKGDMDSDGEEDLVILDSRGHLKIFYQEDGLFRENGVLLENYGFNLQVERNLKRDIKFTYPGIDEDMLIIALTRKVEKAQARVGFASTKVTQAEQLVANRLNTIGINGFRAYLDALGQLRRANEEYAKAESILVTATQALLAARNALASGQGLDAAKAAAGAIEAANPSDIAPPFSDNPENPTVDGMPDDATNAPLIAFLEGEGRPPDPSEEEGWAFYDAQSAAHKEQREKYEAGENPFQEPGGCYELPWGNDELGVDCGGDDCSPCEGVPQCFDGVKNGSEEGIDCGGSCGRCVGNHPVDHCHNGQQDGSLMSCFVRSNELHDDVNDFISSTTKRVKNIDRPNDCHINLDGKKVCSIDIDEWVQYTINIIPNENRNDITLVDIVPAAMELDEESVTCIEGGCEDIEASVNGIHMFLSPLNLIRNETLTITYKAQVKKTPEAAFDIKDLTSSDAPMIPDGLKLDVVVNPPFNSTGLVIYHYRNSFSDPRSYGITAQASQAASIAAEMLEQIMGNLEQFEDVLNNMPTPPDNADDIDDPDIYIPDIDMPPEYIDTATAELTGSDECAPSADVDEGSGSVTLNTGAECALGDVITALENFSCMGGGCLPMPFNFTFMVPPQIPLPLFAVPTALPGPFGIPIPLFALYGAPAPFGMSDMVPPYMGIMSMLRIYLGISLTAGLGMGLCWGPYMGSTSAPPPLVPIPYPPPIGNCMALGLPNPLDPLKIIPNPINGNMESVCSFLESIFNEVIALINSGIGQLNSAMEEGVASTFGGGVSAEEGGGGMEISLGVSLGESNSYEPSASAFANAHIPVFDSIGSVISDWVDRQLLEVFNKLFMLPTFFIILPDFAEEFTGTENLIKSAWSGYVEDLKTTTPGLAGDIDTKFEELDVIQTDIDKAVGTEKKREAEVLHKERDKKMAEINSSVEDLLKGTGKDPIRGLWGFVNSLPLIELEEEKIEVKIPWVNFSELGEMETKMYQAILHYEREWARVEGVWKTLSEGADCQNLDEAANLEEMQEKCVYMMVTDMVGLDLDEFINSIKANLEAIQSYKDFPKELLKYKTQIIGYLNWIACLIDTLAELLGGYLETVKNQLISWAELIATIIEIVKNILQLLDLFINFDSQCALCTNERFGNFGWEMLLKIVIPPLPVITFPKWPDVVFDLSDWDLGVKIHVPVFDIEPVYLPAPPIPLLTLPEIPIPFISLSLPPLPVFPPLPELPPLPEPPAIPTLNLPTLPPPPKLPDIGKAFEVVIPIIELLLKIWCLIKMAFAPVPESSLNEIIATLTNRPMYLMPLDLIKIPIPQIGFDLGFNEIRVDTQAHIFFNFGPLLNTIRTPIKEYNAKVEAIPKAMRKAYAESVLEFEKSMQQKLDSITATINDSYDDLQTGIDNWTEDNLTVDEDAFDGLTDWMEENFEWTNRIQEAFDYYENNIIGFIDCSYKAAGRGAGEVLLQLPVISNAVLPYCINDPGKCCEFSQFEEYPECVGYETIDENFDECTNRISDESGDPFAIKPRTLALSNDPETMNAYDIARHQFKIREMMALLEKPIPVKQTESNSVGAADLPTTEEGEEEPDSQWLTYRHEIIDSFNEIREALKDLNSAEPVEYTVLKERYDVPDYEFDSTINSATKIQWMSRKIRGYATALEQDVEDTKGIRDLIALTDREPITAFPHQLASDDFAADFEVGNKRIYTNVVNTQMNSSFNLPSIKDALQKQAKNKLSNFDTYLAENSIPLEKVKTSPVLSGLKKWSNNASSMGQEKTFDLTKAKNIVKQARAELKVPPKKEQKPVSGGDATDPYQVYRPIPDNQALSEMMFIPAYNTGNQHVLISDGPDVYLKRHKNVNIDTSRNTMSSTLSNNIIIPFNQMYEKFGVQPNLLEAVNMMESGLTSSGSAGFKWAPVTNPNLYGYRIDLEHSVLGFDKNETNNGHPDTQIYLLPEDEELRQAPEVIAYRQGEDISEGTKVKFGTFITSLSDAEEAKELFGIDQNKVLTDIHTVIFKSMDGYVATPTESKAIYFDRLNGSAYNIKMKNGNYQIRMTWFREGDSEQVATRNHAELLAPQVYSPAQDPIDLAPELTYYVPIYKKKTVEARYLLTDLGDRYDYHWVVNIDPEDEVGGRIPTHSGDTLLISPQNEPKEFFVRLIASQNITDPRFKRFEKIFKVVIYIPKINLEKNPLNEEGIVQGRLETPEDIPEGDLSEIPFSLFRNRNGVWKNLGNMIVDDGRETDPPLSNFEVLEGTVYEDNYYAEPQIVNLPNGHYSIKAFDINRPSAVIISDQSGDDVARVNPGNGRIDLLDPTLYELQVLAATPTLPTRIVVIEKATDLILGNVYYVPDSNTDVTIVRDESVPITMENVESLGITVGDANLSDDIISANIPGNAPYQAVGTTSFPGGVAVFHRDDPKTNIALVSTRGDIRFMESGYKLKIRNLEMTGEPFIFQIVTTDEEAPIYDIFINTDFENLQISEDEVMDDTGGELYTLAPENSSEVASFIPVAYADEGNPFNDIDESNPHFSAIKQLYEDRIITGFADGSFRPDEELDRAEFIKIALAVTNCFDCVHPSPPQIEKYKPNKPFPDVKLPSWYYYCVAIGKDLGMITGYLNSGLYRPTRQISRAESAAVLMRQSGITIEEMPEDYFLDPIFYSADPWYKNEVYTAVQIGLVAIHNGFIFPDVKITRGEFAFMAKGIMDLMGCDEVDSDEDGIPDWWEVENGLDPLNPLDAGTDYDFDGLTAIEEFFNGTDPLDWDTDDDGISDKDDPNIDKCNYDNIQNGDETGIDCGGSMCPPCGCAVNGIQDGEETDVDCGGPVCPDCCNFNTILDGEEAGIDCGGPVCPACECTVNGIQDGDEEGVDCGGSICPPCCNFNEIQDGQETGVDCGGPLCPDCDECLINELWDAELGEEWIDCGGPLCPACECIVNEIQDGEETGVDCGGPLCPACECNKNQLWDQSEGEEWIDCGGPVCPPCKCLINGVWDPARGETGVDCGGPVCDPCETCDVNKKMDGEETGVDCGGPVCDPCGCNYNGIWDPQLLEDDVDCGGPICDPCPCNKNSILDGLETGMDCGGRYCPECKICPCSDHPYKNDQDGDGINDPCDEDIDGDGVNNLLCLFEDNGTPIDSMVLASQDNCVFVRNGLHEDSQLNANYNPWGDKCEPAPLCPCFDHPMMSDPNGDLDGDGINDPCDPDIDNDGVPNLLCLFDKNSQPIESMVIGSDDNCVFVRNGDKEDKQKNIDSSTWGDKCELDPYCPCADHPMMSDPNGDLDGDGINDPCDPDIDNDGVPNLLCLFDKNSQPIESMVIGSDDNCVFVRNGDKEDKQKNIDSSTWGDKCELFPICACTNNPAFDGDIDGDGIPNTCDPDIDNDFILNKICIYNKKGKIPQVPNPPMPNPPGTPPGIPFMQPIIGEDNCPDIPNSDQTDSDENGIGDICEIVLECPCRDHKYMQESDFQDTDGDLIGDPCDIDIDADGVENALCLFKNTGIINPTKKEESEDNCIFVPNGPDEDDQADGDENQVGDACEPEEDMCPPVPEDEDLVDDHDGCPEVVVDRLEPREIGVFVTPGPFCNFLDYEADIMDGDKIMTAIVNVEDHVTILSASNQETFKGDN